jgi:ornithine carbamoyltransferase
VNRQLEIEADTVVADLGSAAEDAHGREGRVSVTSPQTRRFTELATVETREVRRLLAAATLIKRQPQLARDRLTDRVLGMIFEQPSLRTRVSFETAVLSLGGHGLYMHPAEVGLGRREAVADVARVISRYVDVVLIRASIHQLVERFADAATIPVVNAMSDLWHPCQAIADVFTIRELLPDVGTPVVVYLGGSGAVANALLFATVHMGMTMRFAGPTQLRPPEPFMDAARSLANATGGEVQVSDNPQEAAADADVLYTTSWRREDQDWDAEYRRRLLRPFRLSAPLLARAKPSAIVLHSLPARRGEEIDADVLDGVQNRVLEQAENRLHVQKALLLWLLGCLAPSFDADPDGEGHPLAAPLAGDRASP